MYDPMRDLIAELEANAGVAAITTRIRRLEADPDDVRGPGSYVAFVRIVRLSGEREKGRVPVQHPVYSVFCYGATDQQATDLYGAVSAALHDRGPRINAGLIYRTFDNSDGGTQKDPDTQQPYVEGVISVHAATAAIS